MKMHLIQADVQKGLKSLPDNSVDMVMTSPPYWGLRDYGEEVVSIWGGKHNCKHEFIENERWNSGGGQIAGENAQVGATKAGIQRFRVKEGYCIHCKAWKGQLGLEPHPNMYINHLISIFHELKRVLKPTGSFYLNLGDTYYGSGGSGGDYNEGGIREGQPKYRQNKSNKSSWLQPKQLLGMPWRVAIAMQHDGWILRNAIIWHKPNPMPASVKDRLNTTYEFVFHFVQQRKYYYDLDAIREPHKLGKSAKFNIRVRDVQKGRIKHIDRIASEKEVKNYDEKKMMKDAISPYQGKGWKGSWPGGGARIVREQDPRWLPPLGKNPGDVIIEKQRGLKSGNPNIGQQQFHSGNIEYHPKGKNPGDFWSITTQPFSEAHFAVFPESLCIKPIKSSCLPKGIVLDPFVGSGTTMKVARDLGRSAIGIEINPEYIKIAKKRLNWGMSLPGAIEWKFEVIE
jgi:site-specific DNA-methyltransferase (cytosine-N4-specific)